MCFLYFQLINNQSISAKSVKYNVLCFNGTGLPHGVAILDMMNLIMYLDYVEYQEFEQNTKNFPQAMWQEHNRIPLWQLELIGGKGKYLTSKFK